MNKVLYEGSDKIICESIFMRKLDEVVYEVSHKHKQNVRRLAKIHKLKQENRVLASKRNSLIDNMIGASFLTKQISGYKIFKFSFNLNKISEQIGKNSAKIQRLRTLISQNK